MDSSPVFVGTSKAAVPVSSPNNEEFLQEVHEAIYKQNFELAIRNKTLSTIRSLYGITMESVDVAEVAQKITKTIIDSLPIEAAFLFLTNQEKNSLILVAATTKESVETPSLPISNREIVLNNEANYCVKANNTREVVSSSETQGEHVPEVYKNYNTSLWKSVVYYPLLKQQNSIGVLALSMTKEESEISKVEHDTVYEILQLLTLAIDRAQLYESLENANNQLTELDKLKDEFVSLASHELRTPMAAIKGSLSTILEGYAGSISEEAREFLAAAYNENDRLIRLVNNLLNTSRIEAGRLSFTTTRINLSDTISEVIKNLQMAAKEKNIYLRFEPLGFLPQVLADEDKIKEVMINLIGNAIKFTTEGGITVTSAVKDDMVLTSVVDTGTGIHKEDFDLLFKKFSQVKTDQKYTKSYGGTGLGLYLSQKIIEGLGGKIWLDSEVGKGTTFCFTLPIAK